MVARIERVRFYFLISLCLISTEQFPYWRLTSIKRPPGNLYFVDPGASPLGKRKFGFSCAKVTVGVAYLAHFKRLRWERWPSRKRAPSGIKKTKKKPTNQYPPYRNSKCPILKIALTGAKPRSLPGRPAFPPIFNGYFFRVSLTMSSVFRCG